MSNAIRQKNKDLTMILIPFVYFIAGTASLAGVASTFFYKDDLGLTLPQVQVLSSIYTLAWSIKPIYGLLSDRRPIWKLRRKPYLFIAGLLSFTGYMSLGTWVNTFTGALFAVLTYAIGYAISDVIVDGIVAEKSNSQKEAGKLQSICRAAIMFGAVCVAYLSGILVEDIGAKNVFRITAILPLFTCMFAFILNEKKIDTTLTTGVKETWNKIKEAMNPTIIWSALFLFVWRATPNSGGSLNYFVIDELGFTAEFFGRLQLVSYSMGIVGIIVFRKWLLHLPLKKLFIGIVFASVLLSLPEMGLVYGWYKMIGISPQFLALADEFVSAPLTEIGMLPLLVLVARVCPKGIEATMFAILASIMNIGLAVSSMGGALLVRYFDVHQATQTAAANYEHIDTVLWIAIFSSFIPLILLKTLPETRTTDEVQADMSPSGINNVSKGIKPKDKTIV